MQNYTPQIPRELALLILLLGALVRACSRERIHMLSLPTSPAVSLGGPRRQSKRGKNPVLGLRCPERYFLVILDMSYAPELLFLCSLSQLLLTFYKPGSRHSSDTLLNHKQREANQNITMDVKHLISQPQGFLKPENSTRLWNVSVVSFPGLPAYYCWLHRVACFPSPPADSHNYC